jgi:cell division protein FtsZ
MAVGRASGEDRARIAAEQAISSQLLDITIDGARGILFNVTGGNNLTLFEVNQAAAIIKEGAHPDVNLIFGAVIDPQLGDEVRITVIATGFDNRNMPRRTTTANVNTQVEMPRMNPVSRVTVAGEARQLQPAEFRPVIMETDDLDLPTFMRKRMNSNHNDY